MKTLLAIIKKELRRFFTDKRMLISIFLPGVLIFTIYSVMGDTMNEVLIPEANEFNIYVQNEPDDLNLFNVDGWIINKNVLNLSEEEIKEKVKTGEVDLFVKYEENFIDKVMQNDNNLIPQVEIFYNSADDESIIIYQYLTTALDAFESQLANRFDINRDINITYDQASEEDLSKKMMGMILPFILVIFLFSGAMGICSESISGEKERGTIATLLVTPVNRKWIAFGKICGLSIVSLTSAVVSFLGLIFSMPKLMGMEFSFEIYSLGTLVAILLVIIVTVLLFTTILTIISTFAKSVKEAANLCVPVMLVVMMLGMSGMFGGGSTNNILIFMIPIYNSIQCFTNILNQAISIPEILLTACSNIVAILLGIYLLTKMFNNEKIMFNK